MNNIYLKFIILFFIEILISRNVVQNWLRTNESFIKSENKLINFTYTITHPDFNNEGADLNGQILTASRGRFKLTIGPRIVFSDGNSWTIYDRRTTQAIIQEPDSTLYEKIFSNITYKHISKLLSVSILRDEKAIIYNDKEKIVLNFEDGIISSVLYHLNSLKVDISKIQFDMIPVVDDSLFFFNDSSVMMIDLRE